MASRLMSDAEIRRRKKTQAHLSQATGGLGLAALGGTMVASRAGRNTLRKIPQLKSHLKAPPKKDPKRDRIKGGITPILATSAGLGGLGAFNFAAYTGAESRKRKAMQPVKKSRGLSRDEMAPEFGEVAKAWSPVAKPYDSEEKRAKRAGVYQATAGGVAGASLAGAAITAGQAGDARVKAKKAEKAGKKKFKATPHPPTPRPKNAPFGPLRRGQAAWMKGQDTRNAGKPMKSKKQIKHEGKVKGLHQLSRKNIKTSGKLAAVGATAVGAHEFVRHQRKSATWAPYSKRDTFSAFGIDHIADTEWTAP